MAVLAIAFAVLILSLHTGGCYPARGGGSDAPTVAALSALGQTLFFDPSLSDDGTVACASCHKPEFAYSDGRVRSVGVAGREGTRNAPSLLDVGRQRSLFWDGRRTRLEDQALDPLLTESEHGLQNEAMLLRKLLAQPRYVEAFRSTYGISADQVTVQHVTRALAAFERTLVARPAPFDRFLAGQRDAMSPAARRGWEIFDRRARCTRCHVVVSGDNQPPLFTDHQFHSLRVGFRKVERNLSQLSRRVIESDGKGVEVLMRELSVDAELAELGRFIVTKDPRDVAAFKTPGLRNVAITGPYMHDGSVTTLNEAIDLEIYYRGGNDARPMLLTIPERNDLIEFLHALTSDGTSAAP